MSIRRFFSDVILSAGLAGGLFNAWPACGQLAPAITPAPRPPEKTYERGDVNLERSRVYIRVGKTGLGHEHAVMGALCSGRVRLGAEKNAGELVFDMARFVADPDAARKYVGLDGNSDPSTQKKVTANMLGRDVLHVAKYPTATCTLRAALPTGKTSQHRLAIYEFQGQFTLHGTTRPIRFLAEVESHQSWVRLTGSFSLLQTDYGITPFTKAFGAIGVANQLTVYGNLWIAAEGSSPLAGGR
jgi:polyisoprenoid-binding protein YceI